MPVTMVRRVKGPKPRPGRPVRVRAATGHGHAAGMTVSIIRVYPGVPIDRPIIVSVVGRAGRSRAVGFIAQVEPLLVGDYLVYPIIPGGLFEGLESTITNTNATWRVTAESALGGTFTYYDGGAWWFDKGTAVAGSNPFFRYQIIDYDGAGSNSATLTHTVRVT